MWLSFSISLNEELKLDLLVLMQTGKSRGKLDLDHSCRDNHSLVIPLC